MSELLSKIVQGKLTLTQPRFGLGQRVLIEFPLRRFDHRLDVTLSQDAASHPIWIERLERVQPLQHRRLAQLLGQKLISLPPMVAYPLVQFTWKMGLQKSASAVGLDLIRYPIVLSTGKLKQSTGFRFQYTAEEAVNAFVSSNLP